MANIISFGNPGFSISEDFDQLVNYTMLYDEGDECTSLTGGWSKGGFNRGSATFDKQSDSMVLYTNDNVNQAVSVMSNNLIDFTNYQAIGMAFDNTIHAWDSEACWSSVNVASTREVITDSWGDYLAKEYILGYPKDDVTVYSKNGKVGVVYIFNNSISGQRYPVVTNSTGANMSMTMTIYNVFALKMDSYQQLAFYAGLSTTFSGINDFISNTSALTVVFNNPTAVNFLLKQCTGTVMCGILGSDTAWNCVPAALKIKMSQNQHWLKFAGIYGRSLTS